MNFTLKNQELTGNTDFEKANQEFLTQLNMSLDFASGNHQKALYYQSKNNTEEAIKFYKKAIEIDNYYNMSRMNLALINYQIGLTDESEKLYLKIIEQEPDFALSHYMLGLLYNELGDTEKSLQYLKQASEREPASVNTFYNYALKLQENKNLKESISTIDKGLHHFPNNERLLYAKVIAQINLNDLEAASESIVLLINIAPSNTNYQQLAQNIQPRLLNLN